MGPRKSAVAIRHLSFEHLGSFESVLRNTGYDVSYIDVQREGIPPLPALQADLLVVLGGPIGAYEEHKYPFLSDELRLLDMRLSSRRPTIGICLGAQLMARALGAHVYPSGVKEIGYGTLELTSDGLASPLRHLGQNDVVLHWHGDTFDLPAGADLLASTEKFENQAFSLGATALGLQFHAEIDSTDIESWLVGHAAELASAGLDARLIRSNALSYGRDVERRAAAFLGEWLREAGDQMPLPVHPRFRSA